MDFGKLSNITNVNFQLPDDAVETQRVLASLPKKSEKPIVYIGCTGWSMKEWIGKVYPKGCKPRDFLKHYTTQFNTIELNTTHYRIPNDDTITHWRTTSSNDFHFCPKVPQIISHSHDLGYGSNEKSVFCNAIQQLNEKLGCCFLQLPPYFGSDRFNVLKLFIKDFPRPIPLAIELRHESWFKEKAAFETVFELFEKNNISPVITDVAGRRDVLHQRLTSDSVLIRFVGNGLHPTDYQRIDTWVERLKSWLKNGLSKVYFFTHEPDNILAPELASYLYKQIQKIGDVQSRGPNLDIHKGGEQFSLF